MSDARETAICSFTGITHISEKISRFAVSRASLIFQKRFPDAMSSDKSCPHRALGQI